MIREAAPAPPSPLAAKAAAWLAPTATLLFHLLTFRGYGFFRDELYYLACAEHLDWGYVDHPPLIAWITALVRATLGDSLFALRLLPALAAAATVWLVVAIARRLGGGPFAQGLAGLAAMLAPVYLSLFGYLSMNSFDILAWAACFALVARILDGGDPRLWLAFGVVAGFGLAVGLVLARRWEVLRNRYFWLGGILAALLFLPHVAWQMAHGWPTAEFMANARAHKMVAMGPGTFLLEQVMNQGPFAFPLWLAGLAFFFTPAGRRFRPFGWTYLSVLALLLATHGKPYYVAPAYTVLFAGGGVALERWTAGRGRRVLRPALFGLLLLGSLPPIPFAKPVLAEDAFVRYAAALGQKPGTDEHHEMGRLPQFFADMHGWPELAADAATAYHQLSPQEQAKACIAAQNYGEAGAIDHFGPALGLPKAISGHNSYFLWGPHGCTGEVVLVIGDRRERLEELFTRVEPAGLHHCTDCMPYENDLPLWIARGIKKPLAEVWPGVKGYI
jgi:hypothetical protein